MPEQVWLPLSADRDYPVMIAEPNRVEPAPRRVQGELAGELVFDTISARYVWEWPNYPQYYIPVEDIDGSRIVDEHTEARQPLGTARRHGLRVGDEQRPDSAWLYTADANAGVVGCARFDWDALDAWYEEDEQIFVHPRNPYVRVDALRSHRDVRVELEGVVLAQTSSPVLVFETGLPTRYYIDRTDVRFEYLHRTQAKTACPYKGTSTDYWSIRLHHSGVSDDYLDLAWSYQYPTPQLLPIAGLVAFYNEKVDTFVDNARLPRPRTHLIM